jgi:hypothetical protein
LNNNTRSVDIALYISVLLVLIPYVARRISPKVRRQATVRLRYLQIKLKKINFSYIFSLLLENPITSFILLFLTLSIEKLIIDRSTEEMVLDKQIKAAPDPSVYYTIGCLILSFFISATLINKKQSRLKRYFLRFIQIALVSILVFYITAPVIFLMFILIVFRCPKHPGRNAIYSLEASPFGFYGGCYFVVVSLQLQKL